MVGTTRRALIHASSATHAERQVAVERIKEFSELPREPPEFVEPRPPTSWPEKGEIQCENLVIRYAVSMTSLSLTT